MLRSQRLVIAVAAIVGAAFVVGGSSGSSSPVSAPRSNNSSHGAPLSFSTSPTGGSLTPSAPAALG
jgi:hypothetical protein